MGRVPGRLTRGRAYLRRARAPVGTLLAGALGGFIVASLVGQFLTGAPILGGTGEPPEARAYVVGLLQKDVSSLLALRPRRDVVSRAQQIQGAEGTQSSLTPVSLTYLGGGTYGETTVALYAVGARLTDGREGLLPFTVTLIDGKVVRIE